jgi:hypothetical protein
MFVKAEKHGIPIPPPQHRALTYLCLHMNKAVNFFPAQLREERHDLMKSVLPNLTDVEAAERDRNLQAVPSF